jgi:hypothetical protein
VHEESRAIAILLESKTFQRVEQGQRGCLIVPRQRIVEPTLQLLDPALQLAAVAELLREQPVEAVNLRLAQLQLVPNGGIHPPATPLRVGFRGHQSSDRDHDEQHEAGTHQLRPLRSPRIPLSSLKFSHV